MFVSVAVFGVALEVSQEMSRASKYYNTRDLRVLPRSTAIAIMSDYHLVMRLRYTPARMAHFACLGGCLDVVRFVFARYVTSANIIDNDHLNQYTSDIICLIATLVPSALKTVINVVHARADIELLRRVTDLTKYTPDLDEIKRIAQNRSIDTVPHQQRIDYFAEAAARSLSPRDLNFGYAMCGDVQRYDNSDYVWAYLHSACINGHNDLVDIIMQHRPDLNIDARKSLCAASVMSGNLQLVERFIIPDANFLGLLRTLQSSARASIPVYTWILDRINFAEEYSTLREMCCAATPMLWRILAPRIITHAKIQELAGTPDDISHVLHASLINAQAMEHVRDILTMMYTHNIDPTANHMYNDISTWMSLAAGEYNDAATHITNAFCRDYMKTSRAALRCNEFVIDAHTYAACKRAAYLVGISNGRF